MTQYTPMFGQLYRHRDGGIYSVAYIASHTTTGDQLVVYHHVWPFEQKIWARPLEEWITARFSPVDSEVVSRMMNAETKETAQQRITVAKAARKECEQHGHDWDMGRLLVSAECVRCKLVVK